MEQQTQVEGPSTLFDNIELIRQLLSSPDVSVNCLDDHGMTPIQHAAFKAKVPICELLLANGADVNINEHENGYTTLMFAALSGNTEVTRMMLEAGAKTTPVNSVGRTAAQMAGFVGQHACVSIINNYFSRDDIDYYTKKQGFEKDPKLKPELAPIVHKLILQTNLNPVKLILFIKEHEKLLSESVGVARVLDVICEKQMKISDTNEVLAMKTHYLACVLRMCHKYDVDKLDGIDGLLKYLLRGREPDGEKLVMEKVIREAIRDFPYHESELLQTMVRNIANVKPGDDPSALTILSQGINGSRSVETEEICITCGETKAAKKCSACKTVNYCNQACQKLHWFTHKKVCKKLAEDYLRLQKLNEELEEKENRKRAEEEEKKEAEILASEEATSELAAKDSSEDVLNSVSISEVTLEEKSSKEDEGEKEES
ncbi:ankyrin repeat and MYND domain-containing protein 2-like isoform X2 [Acanthaster planci]|uniref:Ankyrin repeat and MYND domain-containing protein 2-like isoform X2 n=1 Tax=Acanthaster planci TaxID=133434 RepID=A0A8B7ZSQ7_ACAPL|nr:ankyrin repeat and MYND domain-containing protein 2-like isoform X2 [Acanthaster planci]